MKEKKYENHEYANLFPALSQEEMKNLTEDIAKNGLQNPIVLYNGKVLDGKNRMEACVSASVEPVFEEYTGTAPLEFVISENIMRRHLTTGQRAVIAERLANIEHGGNRKNQSANLHFENISIEDAAEKLNVSSRSVKNIREIKEKNPEAIFEIESGEKTINDVQTEIKQEERQKVKEEKIRSFIPQQNVYNQDFYTSDTSDNSVDIIITDPPYPEKYLSEWEKLSVWASQKLKPSGFLVTLTGKAHFDKVFNILSQNLNYYWLCGFKFTVPAAYHPLKINSFFRPILIFQKPPIKSQSEYIFDFWDGSGRVKGDHDWQQNYGDFKELIKRFANVGDTIIDPFLGAGASTALAAIELKFNYVGYEIDENNYRLACKNIENFNATI